MILSLMYQQYYYVTPDSDKLFGRFNGHLMSNLVTVGEEIHWYDGTRNNESKLKDMITGKIRFIEQKGVDQFGVSNYSRHIFTSNYDYAIPAATDERRFFVIEMENVLTKDELKTLQDFDDYEALMYFMMNRDLSKFDPYSQPYSEGLKKQVERGLKGVDRWIYNAASNGHFGSYRDGSLPLIPIEINSFKGAMYASELFDAFIETVPPSYKNGWNMNRFSREIKRFFGIKHRDKNQNGKVFYSVPSLKDFRKIVEKELNVKIDSDVEVWGG